MGTDGSGNTKHINLAQRFYGLSFMCEAGDLLHQGKQYCKALDMRITLADTLSAYVNQEPNVWEEMWSTSNNSKKFDLEYVTNFLFYHICYYDDSKKHFGSTSSQLQNTNGMGAYLSNGNDYWSGSTTVDEHGEVTINANELHNTTGLPGRVTGTMLTNHIRYDNEELKDIIKAKIGYKATISECTNVSEGDDADNLCDAEYESSWETQQVSADIVNPGSDAPTG